MQLVPRNDANGADSCFTFLGGSWGLYILEVACGLRECAIVRCETFFALIYDFEM
jgi:hypothetical protein